MLALTDGELSIVMSLAQPLPIARRDAFMRSVAVALSTCVRRDPAIVHKLAVEEQRRFLQPGNRARASRPSARYNGGHI